jgi:hypothetical protein
MKPCSKAARPMRVREILATVCGEAMGLDPAHVAELMDA